MTRPIIKTGRWVICPLVKKDYTNDYVSYNIIRLSIRIEYRNLAKQPSDRTRRSSEQTPRATRGVVRSNGRNSCAMIIRDFPTECFVLQRKGHQNDRITTIGFTRKRPRVRSPSVTLHAEPDPFTEIIYIIPDANGWRLFKFVLDTPNYRCLTDNNLNTIVSPRRRTRRSYNIKIYKIIHVYIYTRR